MNLLTNRTWLIFFLAIIFFNCKKDLNEIGLPMKPQDSIGVFFTDTLSISSSVLLTDTLVTSANSGILVGVQYDENFGTTLAKSYLRVFPGSKVGNFAKSTIDSVVLSLALDPSIDSLRLVGKNNHRILVQQLSIPFPKYKHFANESALPVQTTLAQEDFIVKPNSVLNFKLNPQIGQLLLALSGDTNKVFSDFKGLAFVPDESINKSILTFNLADSKTKFSIYFKDSAGTATTFNYFLGNGENTKFYTLSTTRNGTPLALLQANNPINTLSLENFGYVQNGTGVGTKITFPGITKLVKDKVIIVNSASLIVTPIDTTATNNNFPLTLFATNATNTTRTRFTIAGAQGPEFLNSFYSDRLNRYEFNLTSYIQSAIYKNREGDGIIIAGASAFNAYGIRLFADNRNLIPQNMRMKLLIYYTEVL